MAWSSRPGFPTDYVAKSLALAGEGAEAAGRGPGDVRRAAYLYFAVSEDGISAITALREKLAFLMRNRFIQENVAESGLPIDLDAVREAASRRDTVEMRRLVPEEAVDAFAVGGDTDTCRRRLEAYIAAGVDEPSCWSPWAGQRTDRWRWSSSRSSRANRSRSASRCRSRPRGARPRRP